MACRGPEIHPDRDPLAGEWRHHHFPDLRDTRAIYVCVLLAVIKKLRAPDIVRSERLRKGRQQDRVGLAVVLKIGGKIIAMVLYSWCH